MGVQPPSAARGLTPRPWHRIVRCRRAAVHVTLEKRFSCSTVSDTLTGQDIHGCPAMEAGVHPPGYLTAVHPSSQYSTSTVEGTSATPSDEEVSVGAAVRLRGVSPADKIIVFSIRVSGTHHDASALVRHALRTDDGRDWYWPSAAQLVSCGCLRTRRAHAVGNAPVDDVPGVSLNCVLHELGCL